MYRNYYNPNDFQNYDNDSDMIQAAVNAAAKSGVKVEIPRWNQRTGKDYWNITKAIELHTGSVIILDNSCLRLADGVFCNIFKNSNGRTEIGKTIQGRQY